MAGVTNIAVYDCTVNAAECRDQGVSVFPSVVIYHFGTERSRFVVTKTVPSVSALATLLLQGFPAVLEIESAEELVEVTSMHASGIGHVLVAQYPSFVSQPTNVDSELRKLRELFHSLANIVTVNCETAEDGDLCQRIGVDTPSVWLYSEPTGSALVQPTRVVVPPSGASETAFSAKLVHTALVKLLPSPPVIEPWTLSAVTAEGEYRLRREGLLVFFLGQKSDPKSKILERIAREMHSSAHLWSANGSIGIGIVNCRDGEAASDSADLGTLTLPEVRL